MKTRIILFIVAIAFGEFAYGLFTQTADPQIRTSLALDSVNSTNIQQRAYEQARSSARLAIIFGYIGLASFLFAPAIAGAIKPNHE